MKVSELIKKLQAMPQDAEVWGDSGEHYFVPFIEFDADAWVPKWQTKDTEHQRGFVRVSDNL